MVSEERDMERRFASTVYDFIRELHYDSDGTKLNRSDVTRLLTVMSEALEMDKGVLITKLGLYYRANQERLDAESDAARAKSGYL